MLEGLRLACRRVQPIAGLALAIALALGTANAQKAISFVQVNSTTPVKQSSVTVSYIAAQTAGDLNVVVVGWSNSTAKISSVADSEGNTYALAAGPTVQSGTATQAIYYAKNIVAAAANSNSVTVTFSAAANYPDLRIAEYAGLDPSNPVDVAVAATGTSTSGSSGSVTTTNANDLLVGADVVQTVTSAAGTGYTSRVITTPDGDILEDRIVTTMGSYSATASISPSGEWIMQMVAFRAAGSGAGMMPSITNTSPSSGAVGTAVTIAGTNFGSTQGTSTVAFNGTVATPTSWSATSIAATVPSGATTGNVLVTVSGLASNGVSFTVTTTSPSITSLNPSSAPVGTSVTVTGTNFGSTRGTSTVTFNGAVAAPTSWNATSIAVAVPSGATTGNVLVTVSGLASNGVSFTVTTTSPSITSLNPSSAPVATSVTVTGTNFGSTQGTSTVTFNGTVAAPTSWSATSIAVAVPSGATTGNVVVTVGGLASNGLSFTVTTTNPSITSINPSSAPVGTSVTIAGTNFGATQGTSTVTFNGTVAAPTSWSATSIAAPVPSGATTGNVVVTVSGLGSNGVNFTVTGTSPNITGLNPSSAPVGTSVTITGTNFGSTQGTSTVAFNGTVATPTSWSATSIAAPVPSGASTGNVVVTVSGLASNGVSFTVTDPAVISFVQVSSAVPATPQTSVTAAYTKGQTAGDLNVVVVGWNDSTAKISSVADSAGNTYALAVGPTVQSGTATQAIYYAKNIVAAAANSNSVTVRFSAAANYPDLRIAEYAGLDPSNPVDVAVAATGMSTSGSSGSVTTANANDLLVGADVVQTVTSAAGTGYTSRVITTPDGDILEDRIVTTMGSYSATASISPSGEWIMQMVAFRAAGSGAGTMPSITNTSPSSGAVGTAVTIAGTNFGSTQGTSTVAFNGTVATPTSWSATSIAATVPSGATTGNVLVTVSGLASNGVSFTVTTTSPSITSLNPSSAPVGTSVTVTGTNFGSTRGTSTVTFNGAVAAPTSWNATSIAVAVPSGATTGNVLVTVSGLASNGVSFTVTTTSPSITSLNPSSAPVGTSVTVTGTNFGSTQGTSTVTFNGTVAAPTSWSATSIAVAVPSGATTGNVVVTVGGLASNGLSFTVTTTNPSITSINPSSAPVGTSVTIAGTNFGATQGTSTVTFNGTVAAPTSWSATSIVAPVPTGATTGNVVVTVGGLASNGVSFTVTTTNPSITSLNPSSAPVATSVTIAGTNFGSTQGTSTVMFNGTAAATTSWSATSIAATVPSGATTGNVVVTVGGLASNGVSFTVTTTNPSITSLSPSSGPVGAVVTIAGTNFGAAQGASTITFNGAMAAPTSWSATSIVVPVPAGATTGNVVVTMGSQASNGASFTVSIISSGGPTIVQHVSSSNTRGIDLASPFCYYFQLPNPTTSGNAVIVGVTFGSNSTPTVTDDQGDSYTIMENYFDSAESQAVAIAAALNVSSGARNISVCFSSDPGGWVQPMATEFNNVVAVDGSGTGSQGTGTSVTAGTLTPAESGDLAYQVVFSTSANQSNFTAGSQGNISWNLLSGDLMDGWAGQYGVYNSTSAINPTMSMGTSQEWLSAAILLQVGTTGSVPSGMRIVHLVHENIPIHEASGGDGSFPNPMPLQLPSSGNLLVAMIGGGPNFETVTSLADSNNNSWIQAGSTFVTPNGVMVQTYFAGNAISSSDLGLTLIWSGADGDYSVLLYDVAGAATSPLDTTNGATDVQSSASGTLTVPYTLTPAQAGELIFTDIMWDANTGTGLTSDAGTSYLDTNLFSGESLNGPAPADENNGWGDVISTSTSPMSFTWSQLSPTTAVGNWASMAVAFLPADPPGN